MVFVSSFFLAYWEKPPKAVAFCFQDVRGRHTWVARGALEFDK